MKKLTSRAAIGFLPLAIAAALAQSCAGGQTDTGDGKGSGGSGHGSGGSHTVGSGGTTGGGSGGTTGGGSGGSTGTGSGGSIVTPGTGGSTGTGSGGSTTTGSGGAPPTGGALTVAMGGFVTSGPWKGYAFAFTGPKPPKSTTATISPTMFTTQTQLCVTGMIAPDTTYESVAGFGFNVNQVMATTTTEPPIESIAISGSGLAVNVTATGLTLMAGPASQLRVQVKSSADVDYCAPIAATGMSTIPWTSFNTQCWPGGAGTNLPSGSMIKAINLIVPSSNSATTGPFNICLLDAHPT